MKLQTEIPLESAENQIDYSSKILLLGSCFSENIGSKFDFFKFQNIQNPFGVIFNPVSMERLIVRAIGDDLFGEKDIFQHNGVYKCFEVHSQLNCLNKLDFLNGLNGALQNLKEAILSSTHIIFTFGTSWVYRNLKDDGIIANCHKIPQNNFKKELLPVQSISEALNNIYTGVRALNPDVVLINTISPVRHIKDGFVENSISKAHLISALHNSGKHKSSGANHQTFYFPSYEIMMDELRDYRFYAEDMIHPNATAIEILWQKFSKVWISPEADSIKMAIASIQAGLQHRPFNPESEAHRHFQNQLQEKIDSIKARFPHIRF